jgi:hypothetical protein
MSNYNPNNIQDSDAQDDQLDHLEPQEQAQLEALLTAMPLHQPSSELDGRVIDELAATITPDQQAQLEAALTALPLRQPSPALDGRVHNTIADTIAPPSLTFNRDADQHPPASTAPVTNKLPWAMFALAAAACIALAAMLLFNPANNTNDNPNKFTGTPGSKDQASNSNVALANFNPVRFEQMYTNVQPDGIVFVDDETPMRRFRRQHVEHVQLVDEKQNIRIEITLPQNDVIVTPIGYD